MSAEQGLLGMTEAELLVRPYPKRIGRGESFIAIPGAVAGLLI